MWLDRRYTSPFKFYQFWLNVSDEDAARYIKIFTELPEDEIRELEARQQADPGKRPLQRRLAEEITTMVHSAADTAAAIEASQILFSNKATESLRRLDEATLLEVFEGVPTFEVSRADIAQGIKILDLVADKAPVFPSKGEARKLIQQGGFSINKDKFTDPQATVDASFLLNDRYILVQKGKKQYFLIKIAD